MIYIQVVALAIVLIVVFPALQRLLLKVVASPAYRRVLLRWFPLAEIVAWIGYAFWAVASLFGGTSYSIYFTAGISIVVVLVIGWYLARDVLVGFILRSENFMEPGLRFQSGETEGVISRVGYRSLELTTDEGETVKLPYSLIASKRLVRQVERGRLTSKPIVLDFRSKLPPDEVRQRLLMRLLEMPWVLSSFTPEIRLSVKSDGDYSAEITLRVVNEELRMKTIAELIDFTNRNL